MHDLEGQPQPPPQSSERSLEWKLPASFATKDAIARMADQLVPIGEPPAQWSPEGNPVEIRFFESRSGAALELDRLVGAEAPGGSFKRLWTIIHSPTQDLERDVHRVDMNRIAEREGDVKGIMYELVIAADTDDITLDKVHFSEEPMNREEASEGEAKWLLSEMTGAQEFWPDAYRSSSDEPDSSGES